ncbi:MAG: acyltransferase [Deltaproteobacteria bacterium]|nr:acyltransferase [Deltaproteobacteria bacterium]
MHQFRSHGTGEFSRDQFAEIGENVILERGVMVFHPEMITLGSNVYVGHNTLLKGYYKNTMRIGSDVWIGQQCFLHSGGGLTIGNKTGIGPGVNIFTSSHMETDQRASIMDGAIKFAPVVIGEGCDIGVGATIMPGVRVGRGVQIGTGSVVVEDVPDYAIAVGVPARVMRIRDPGE